MDLNKPLSARDKKLVAAVTDEQPLYCADTDISLDGGYASPVTVCATRSYLFVIGGGRLQEYPLASLEDVKNSNQVDCGLLIIVKDGEQMPVARYSRKQLARFAYIARGINLLVRKKYDKKIESREPEPNCPKCGRALPQTRLCPKCDNEGRNLKRFASLCSPYKLVLALILSLMLIGSAMDLYKQFVFRYFIDDHLIPQNGTLADVAVFFGILLAMSIAEIVFYLVRFYMCNKLGTKISMNLRGNLYNKLQELSLSYITKRDPGALIHRVSGDTDRVKDFMQNAFCDMFGQLVTLIALIVIMMIMNWRLALCALAFAPLIVIFARTFWPHIRRIFHNQWRRMDRISNKLQDILSGIRVVKTFGKEKSEIEKFSALNEDYARTNSRNEVFFSTFYPLLSLLLAFGTYIIVYVGGADVLNGQMSPGELVQFISYAGMLLGPLSWMSFLPRRIVQTSTSLERIYDILDEAPEIDDSTDSACPELIGDISLKGVTFGYNNYEPVLEDISLDVKSGEMIGLVGSSGAGKSTLINLIMRLYDVDEGAILIDGEDLRNISKSYYHKQIGVVLQETFLFSGTILNNIRFSRPDASMEQIILAAKQANAHEFICKLPDGYNTYVGERGHNLSGGEKQRVAIARAILTNPRILILDEATSALDTESEYQVQEALERLRKGRTTFAIAHRLSTLRNADRIMVIDNHRCAEIGTHNELLRQKGIYYGLVMAQLQMSKTK